MDRNHIVMFLSREGQSKPVRKLVITSETVTETNLSTYVSPAIMTKVIPTVQLGTLNVNGLYKFILF